MWIIFGVIFCCLNNFWSGIWQQGSSMAGQCFIVFAQGMISPAMSWPVVATRAMLLGYKNMLPGHIGNVAAFWATMAGHDCRKLLLVYESFNPSVTQSIESSISTCGRTPYVAWARAISDMNLSYTYSFPRRQRKKIFDPKCKTAIFENMISIVTLLQYIVFLFTF